MANEKLTKQEFVDKYPYIVYTDMDTIVYSGKADTSIDDVPGGGGGTAHSAKCYSYNISTGVAVEIPDLIYKCAYTYPMTWAKTGEPISTAAPGELLCIDCSDIAVSAIMYTSGTDIPTSVIYGVAEMVGDTNVFTMPDGDLCALLTVSEG